MRKLFVPILIAASLAGLSTSASAEEVTVSVNIADLDLTKVKDVAVLQDRLATALKDACPKDYSQRLEANKECIANGIANGEKVISEMRQQAPASS